MAIELDDEKLNYIHLVEMEMLIEIDRICIKNNINYSLTGGTLLGAVRSENFIPWDDDADISMLREDYVKFQQACKTDLDQSRFYFQDIENTDGYRWGYGKLRRKNSIFLRENQENMPYEQGIFLDIFPRDGIPDKMVEKKLHEFLCFTVRKIMWSVIGKKIEPNFFKRCVYCLLAKLPYKYLVSLYNCLVNFSNNAETKLVRALTFPLPNGVEGYDRAWYRDYTRIKLAGRYFSVEASYEKWLLREFGNYMELPPLEKRKAHPVSKIEFPMEILGEMIL